ncbi:hypothetical protein C8R44DRAFT_873288 [Mycena epipterygia]|nr:hypothetical protein C8R44DRAFT_873288 [Mycena epipterygia]
MSSSPISRIPFPETRRLFGPSNNPAPETNARHRALLRKGLELFSPEELNAVFGRPTKLRFAMGSGMNAFAFGQIKTHFVRNGQLVARETDIPDAASQQALTAYRHAYNVYFFTRGADYSVRNVHALPPLQAAEQAWHDYIVPYQATRGMGPRSRWALEPLPGLQRVRLAPEIRCLIAFPTPPRTSPVRNEDIPDRAPIRPRLPALIPVGSRLLLIDLTGDVAKGLPKMTQKHKRAAMAEVIEVSDSEDERPRKKVKFLGFLDLTI